MATDRWDLGDAVPVSVTFRGPDGALADPTDVALLVLPPSGDKIDPETWEDLSTEVNRDSEGIYSAMIDADEPGLWRYRFSGTGDVQKSRVGTFYVRERWRASP